MLEKIVRSLRQLLGLRPTERETRERTLEALNLMRQEGHSASEAAELAGTTTKSMRRYLGDALEQDGRRLRASRGDRLYRELKVLTTEGTKVVGVRGSGQASLISQHANAVRQYLATGQTGALAPFAGRTIAGLAFETDPTAIEEHWRRGELDWEDLYGGTD